jgi:hypothetical protein
MKNNRKLMVASTEKFNRHMYYEISNELGITSPELYNKETLKYDNLMKYFDRHTDNKTDINK